MTLGNRTDRFYGAFDPKIPGHVFFIAGKDRFSAAYQRNAKKQRLARSQDWSSRDHDFILFESAYVHEVIHMLQYNCTPLLGRVFRYRMGINAAGSLLLHEFKAYSDLLHLDGSQYYYIPTPLAKWVFADLDARIAMEAEALEELDFLGVFAVGAPRYRPFLQMPEVAPSPADRAAFYKALAHTIEPGFGAAHLGSLNDLVALTAGEYVRLLAIMQDRAVFIASELSAVAAQLAFVTRAFGPDAMREIARALMAAGTYREIDQYLSGLVTEDDPSPERLMMACCAGFWALLSPASGDGQALAETEQRLALVAKTDWERLGQMTPTETFRYFDRQMGVPSFGLSISANATSLSDTRDHLIEFNQNYTWHLEHRRREFIAGYAMTAAEGAFGYCQSLLNTDDMLSMDNIVGLTHYVSSKMPIFYLKREPHAYASVAEWQKPFSMSYSGIPWKYSNMVIEGYAISSTLDALFLGDSVNIVSTGQQAIGQFVSKSLTMLHV